MKWYFTEKTQNQKDYIIPDAPEFWEKNDIYAHGHDILWDDPNTNPLGWPP